TGIDYMRITHSMRNLQIIYKNTLVDPYQLQDFAYLRYIHAGATRILHLTKPGPFNLCTFINRDYYARHIINYSSRLNTICVYTSPNRVKVWDLIEYYIEYEFGNVRKGRYHIIAGDVEAECKIKIKFHHINVTMEHIINSQEMLDLMCDLGELNFFPHIYNIKTSSA